MAKANHTLPVTPLPAARRGVLLGALVALTVSKCAPAAAVTRGRVGEAADALTAALAELHGGKWAVTVNHELQFVLIVGGAK